LTDFCEGLYVWCDIETIFVCNYVPASATEDTFGILSTKSSQRILTIFHFWLIDC